MRKRPDVLAAGELAMDEFDVVLRLLAMSEHDEAVMFDNLTTTQARCDELLEENRALRARVAELESRLGVADALTAEAEKLGMAK